MQETNTVAIIMILAIVLQETELIKEWYKGKIELNDPGRQRGLCQTIESQG